MGRHSYVYDAESRKLITRREYDIKKAEMRRENRSAFPVPHVISDTMTPIKSMIDGRDYDSKAAYYRSVRSAGCEIVGNDPSAMRPSAPDYDERKHESDIVADVKKAIEIEASK